MMRLARVTGLLLGLLIGSGGGVLHGQISSRGQCYWRVMADSSQVSQHLQQHVALNSLLAAHRAYPVDVALWMWFDCVADLNRTHPNLRESPSPTPPDTLPVDTVPGVEPDPDPPDTVVVIPPDTLAPDTAIAPAPPVDMSHLLAWDTIGSGATVTQEDSTYRVVMGAGGFTFVRMFSTLSPGSYRVVVRSRGTGGCFRYGTEVFDFVDTAEVLEQMFYRMFPSGGDPVLEIDNCNEPMDRVFHEVRIEEVWATRDAELDAIVIPRTLEMAIADQVQICAIWPMPGGGYLLDAAQMLDPVCFARFNEYIDDPAAFAP